MATVVNNPQTSEPSNTMALVVAVTILLAAIFFFFYFGRGLLSRPAAPTAPSIEIPRQIDVNVNSGGE